MGNIAARKFGLVYRMPENIASIYQYIDIMLPSFNGDDSNELPVAATYIISRNGKIAGGFINIDFMVRPDPDRIIDVLNSIR
ncbi:MAG: AhpC/TSA family protein, partial [Candidatus Zixiibacteriota bacterium]